MFRMIGWLIKVTLFSIVVLVLGNWIHWGGKTLSRQVNDQFRFAEHSRVATTLRHWTTNVTEDARQGGRRMASTSRTHSKTEARVSRKNEKRPEGRPMERIESSERQKLRALIDELNSSSASPERRANR